MAVVGRNFLVYRVSQKGPTGLQEVLIHIFLYEDNSKTVCRDFLGMSGLEKTTLTQP